MLWLGYLTFLLNTTIDDISLERAVSPGRTKADVIAWLGEPRATKKISIPSQGIVTVMLYPSTGEFRSLQGTDDVVVALDADNIVVASYYPDSPHDRRIRDILRGIE